MKKLFVLSLSLALYSAAQGQNDLQPSPGDAPSAPAITHQALPTDDVALETCIVIAKCKDVTLKTFPGGGGGALLGAPDVNNGSSSSCGLQLTYTLSKSVFDCAHDLGIHDVTLTVTDSRGTSASCVAKVTIVDGVQAKCKDVTLTLDNGTVELNPSQLDNGSGFVCGSSGSLTFTASKTKFTCANLGKNTVTLTASSGSDNNATCPATVTVVGITDIGMLGNFKLPLINNPAVVAKLDPWTAYKGWTWNAGQQHGEIFQLITTLFAAPGTFIQGTAPYTYKWTLNGQNVGNNANVYNGSASNLAAGRYVYHVGVTDVNGCKGEVTLPVNIVDVRCKIKKTKDDGVLMCLAEVKKNKTKYSEECVYPDKVEENLLNQFATWTIGACPNNNGNGNGGDNNKEAEGQQANVASIAKEITSVQASPAAALKAFPNPSRDGFTLDVVPPDTKQRFLLKVMDNTGRVVEEKVLGAAQRLQIGASYKPGMYYVELQQGTQKSTLKLIKQ